MKVSTRNTLKGKVKKIEHGSVNSEVIVELPGGQEIVSIITKTSTENLELTPGKNVYVLIKASNVMIATED
jgi:molybdopterin-binding protein